MKMDAFFLTIVSSAVLNLLLAAPSMAMSCFFQTDHHYANTDFSIYYEA